MKKIAYLIFLKVKSIITENPLVSVMIIVGMMACNIMFLYGYGFLSIFMGGDYDDYYIYRTDNAVITDPMMLEEILLSYSPTDTVNYYTEINPETSHADNYTIDTSEVIRAIDNMKSYSLFNGTEEDFYSDHAVLIPPSEELPEQIVLNGVEFHAVAYTLGNYVMSLDNYVSAGFVPDAVSFRLRDGGKSLDSLKSELDGYEVEFYVMEENTKYTIERSLQFYAIFLVCLASFIFLCTYIYDDSTYELTVYEMMGASRGVTTSILCGAIFVIMSLVSAVSQIVYAIMYKPVFSRMLEVYGLGSFTYSILDYFIVYVITVLLVLVFIVVYTKIRLRKSLISNIRHSLS